MKWGWVWNKALPPRGGGMVSATPPIPKLKNPNKYTSSKSGLSYTTYSLRKKNKKKIIPQ